MNRNCMAAVVRSEELRHHGVMGMEWGERHGPPYPLDGLDKKVARAEAKRKKARERALEKARKAAKKQRKAAARELKLEAKQAKKLQKDMILKEKLLADGDLDAIKKHRKLFSTQELNDAIIRARVLEEVKTKKPSKTSDPKPATPKEKVDVNNLLASLAAGAASVGTIAKAGIGVVTLVEAVRKASGQTAAQNVKAGPKEIDALAKAFSSSKSEGGSAKVDVKSEKASKKPDPTAKEATQQLPKSVQSVLPQELIDSFRDPLIKNSKSDELGDAFFKSLSKSTGISKNAWDSMMSTQAKDTKRGTAFKVSSPIKVSELAPESGKSRNPTFEDALAGRLGTKNVTPYYSSGYSIDIGSVIDSFRGVKLY